MITSTIHVLILIPVFFVMMKARALRQGTLRRVGEVDLNDYGQDTQHE
jgi:Cu(I)/Ag(I) efflux system membrane protein CusA/SilA